MPSLELQVSGGFTKIDKIAVGLADWNPFLKRIAAAEMRRATQTFHDAKDPVDGAAWEPLSGFTRLSRNGSSPLRNFGLLAKSYASAPEIGVDCVKMKTNRPGARLHQMGGVIRPKNAKHLALPMSKEAARFGSARAWWSANESKKPFILTTEKRAFASSLGAKKWIVTRREGTKDKLDFHFSLRDQVKIPRRRFSGIDPATIERYGAMLLAWLVGKPGEGVR